VYFRDGKVEFPADRPTSRVFPLGSETTFTSPLMAAILRTFALQGTLVLHGAGILLGDLAVLVLGASGSGKSTFAAAAVGQGYKVISDDLVLVCEGGPRHAPTRKPELYPMRPDMYLRPDTVRLLPRSLKQKLTRVRLFRGEKLRLMRQQARASFSDRATLGCILALQTGARAAHGTLAPLHQGAGLAAVIAASTYLSTMRTAAKRPLMAAANRLVSSTPAFAVSTGTELLRHPRRELTRIESLLRQHLS
jgi:hypothetical protein